MHLKKKKEKAYYIEKNIIMSSERQQMPQLENKHRMLCFFLSLEEFLEIKNMISGKKLNIKFGR